MCTLKSSSVRSQLRAVTQLALNVLECATFMSTVGPRFKAFLVN